MPFSRLFLFSFGDFSFNLYWQSLVLYLFFFYTDAMGLSAATAGLLYMVGSIWDGMADLAVGLRAQADRGGGGYRRYIRLGAVPLGLSFVLLYLALPVGGALLAGFALVTHFVFRSLYALVNIPYSAMTTRVSQNSDDRAMMSGLRMVFGTAAAVIVALGTPAIARLIGAGPTSTGGFLLAAAVFAVVGTLILLRIAAQVPEHLPVAGEGPSPDWRRSLSVLLHNRAFVTLSIAMAVVVIGATLLGKSVLYYFTYVLADPTGGPRMLAMMGFTGIVFVPAWMFVARYIGTRALWFACAIVAVIAIIVFAVLGGRSTLATQIFLIAVQGAMIGFNFIFWAMLPDTVEYGEHVSGVRVEAMAYGVSALLQKVSLGLAAGLMGVVYSAIGYVAHAEQSAATLSGMTWVMLAGPGVAFFVSALAMIANPLRRDTHARIVADLARGKGAAE